jgi:hypothetical protein
MVPAEGCPQHWGLASGGIGLDHQGQQVAAGLIYEDVVWLSSRALFSGRASAPLSSVVLDPEVAPDNLGHSGLGPDVAAKAQGRWPLGQQFQ